ncbi:FAD-binding oxidoreductase [candidate division KSB1 bacterium]|nr:MAG: FAD-binding oxidoreductase [candidate division KSB1 bacterium]
MSAQTELTSQLREIAEQSILQEEPYPVVAPASVEDATAMIRAARDHSFRVMVLGSGSSFPEDFSLHRSNVMAVLSVKLTGMEPLSPFTVRVYCGTPAAALFENAENLPRRTLGGLLCSIYRSGEESVLSNLWPRIRQLQVITGLGELHHLAGPAGFQAYDCGAANVLLGSRGRLGMITAAELLCPFPIVERNQDGDSLRAAYGSGETSISRTDLQPLFDSSGLFQW